MTDFPDLERAVAENPSDEAAFRRLCQAELRDGRCVYWLHTSMAYSDFSVSGLYRVPVALAERLTREREAADADGWACADYRALKPMTDLLRELGEEVEWTEWHDGSE